MAWTNPKTFLAGAIVAASELNTYLRDNLRLLKTAISDRGQINFQAATELTIAAGAITVTRNLHTLDTEDDAASDDLDTMTAGTAVAAGFLLTVLVGDTARAITLKDGTGNLALGRDIVVHGANQMAVLVYDGTHWRAVTMAGGIKSIQRGTISIQAGTASTNSATIAEVDLSKAVVLNGGFTSRSNFVRIFLDNATTVKAVRVGANINSPESLVAYQVVEFY